MVVLAFLSDPDVVGRILHHLGLPTTAPALAPAKSSGGVLGFDLSAPLELRIDGRARFGPSLARVFLLLPLLAERGYTC